MIAERVPTFDGNMTLRLGLTLVLFAILALLNFVSLKSNLSVKQYDAKESELHVSKSEGTAFFILLRDMSVVLGIAIFIFRPMAAQVRKTIRDQDTLYQQLKRASSQLESTVFALNQYSIVTKTNPRGVITEVNDKFCQITGYTRDELIGRTHRIVNSGYHSKEFFATFWKTIKQGKIWKGEIKNKKKDGSYYWVDSTIVPLKNQEGDIIEYVGIRVDITERKLLQERLSQAEKMSALGTLAAGVAHELNNPLMGIINYIQFSRRNTSPDNKIYTRLEKAEREARRSASIVKNLLTYSRSNQNDKSEKLNEINPVDLFGRGLALLANRIKTEQVDVYVESDKKYPRVLINMEKAEQIILNLLTNALDSMKGRSIRKLNLSVAVQDGALQVRVGDSGGGIPAEIQSKIFDPFFTTKPTNEGTGLGLSICRSMAREIQGDIEFESQTGVGTTFLVTFPIRNQLKEAA